MMRKRTAPRSSRFAKGIYLSVFATAVGFCTVGRAATTVLLNNSFADGTRTTSNNPGVVQPVYVGASITDNSNFATGTETINDAVNTVTGKMQNLMGTGSRKNWVYFTPDGLPPDANSPPSDTLSMTVGQTLTASMTFVIPTNLYHRRREYSCRSFCCRCKEDRFPLRPLLRPRQSHHKSDHDFSSLTTRFQ